MELFCPHCTRRVSVPDDKAGQVMSCPLCAKQFQAPALAPPPIAPVPPMPAPPSAPQPESTYSAGEPPLAPKATPSEPDAAAPPPPSLPGDYTHSVGVCLNDSWLAFVPPACVFLVFILSFFSWHLPVPNLDDPLASVPALSMWGLGFNQWELKFVAYIIIMIPTSLLTYAALPFDKGWIPAPPPIAPFMPFKNVLVGLLLGLAFLMLCIDYLTAHFGSSNPIALAFKLAFRLHFFAMLASFGMFWLNWRKKNNLPLPRVDARW